MRVTVISSSSFSDLPVEDIGWQYLLRTRAKGTPRETILSRHSLIQSLNVGTPRLLLAKRNPRLARERGGGRLHFSIARFFANTRFRLAFPPSRDNASLDSQELHLRVISYAFRPNGMVVVLPLFLELTIMQLPLAW